MEINKYKPIIVQTLQSQIQESVEMKKHMRKHKVKLHNCMNAADSVVVLF